MKPGTYGTLKGLTVTVQQYESYDEADKRAGKANAMLDEGNASLAYRGPLGEGRDILCTMLEEQTGVERKTRDTGKKDKDGAAILAFDESEGEYASRVCAEKGFDDLKEYQAAFDAACAAANEGKGLSVDILRPERKPSLPKKLAAKYLEKATAIINNGNVDKFLAKFAQVTGKAATYVVSGDAKKDAESLGWIAKAYVDFLANQALESEV